MSIINKIIDILISKLAKIQKKVKWDKVKCKIPHQKSIIKYVPKQSAMSSCGTITHCKALGCHALKYITNLDNHVMTT